LYRFGCPASKANSDSFTVIHATDCAPAARRQFAQWQFA
jgi:hypothetical protein